MGEVFAERLRKAMFMEGLRQVDLVEKTGIDKGSIHHYLNGKYMPNGEKLTKLAAALCVSPDWLLGRDVEEKRAAALKAVIPIVGKVAAGVPILAEQNVVGYLPADGPVTDLFALTIKGDSMSPRIMDGDVVIVRRQEHAEDGDVVIALFEDEATCKVFHRSIWGIMLVPFNPSYEPIIFSREESEKLRILGVVIESRHRWQ